MQMITYNQNANKDLKWYVHPGISVKKNQFVRCVMDRPKKSRKLI